MQQALANLKKVEGGSLLQVLEVVMAEGERLSGSTLSYFATISDKEDVLTMIGWSKTAMGNCGMINKPIIYPVKDTGLWGDAVRERKPVFTNDYKNLKKPTKKGYPTGHVDVARHMNFPVWEGTHIVGVYGVGNKKSDYTDKDFQTLDQFLKEAWKIIKEKL